MNTVPMRYLDGTFTGHVSEGGATALRVRTTAPITIRRDTDGTWLAYVSLDDARLDDDATSREVQINHPAACRAFNALFELVADPVTFAGCTIDPERPQDTEEA